MLDFNHIISTPGYNLQYFEGMSSGTLTEWKTWVKPRGVNWVYVIGVGAGGGGGGTRNSVTAGGGGGGGSGAQSILLIPSMFVPDTLYIQVGNGSAGGGNTTGGSNGIPTYVCIEPDITITPNMTLLLANAGGGGGPGTASAGTTGAAGAVTNIANMCLAGRGRYNFFAGQAGGLGGTTGAPGNPGASITPPATGLMVTGGAGGGGGGTTGGGAGGNIATIAGMLGTDFFSLPTSIAAGASVATPAGTSAAGFSAKNFLFNFGGGGGGGASTTAGGTSSGGSSGAPGCGGGGTGGCNTTNTTISPGGNGGPGFVYIISW